MAHINWMRVLLAAVIALAALFVIRLHNASGATPRPDNASAGRGLVQGLSRHRRDRIRNCDGALGHVGVQSLDHAPVDLDRAT